MMSPQACHQAWVYRPATKGSHKSGPGFAEARGARGVSRGHYPCMNGLQSLIIEFFLSIFSSNIFFLVHTRVCKMIAYFLLPNHAYYFYILEQYQSILFMMGHNFYSLLSFTITHKMDKTKFVII
jgi:hypothetical protein